MTNVALTGGLIITCIGIIDIVVTFFRPACGLLAVAGSIILAAGIIAAAIEKKHSA